MLNCFNIRNNRNKRKKILIKIWSQKKQEKSKTLIGYTVNNFNANIQKKKILYVDMKTLQNKK